MTTGSDDRPTPPERVHISYGDADLLAAMGPLPDDLTYRLSDPADPLVRLSEALLGVRDAFYPDITDQDIAAVEACTLRRAEDRIRRLTAERGGGGGSEGEGK